MTTFPLDIRADVWLGASLGWVELPLRTEAGGGGVRIKRDRKPGAALPDPGTCTLVIDDRSSTWSPRNPRGAYFGLIGRNTPVRVSYDGRASWRFVGEVTSWSPRWSLSEADRTVSIECAGVLRRLLASNAAALSPMRRSTLAAGPAAYWPLEDGVIATQAASAIAGHPAATITGTAQFADVGDYSWSTAGGGTTYLSYGTGRLLDLKSGATVSALVPADVTAATASAWTVSVMARTEYTLTSAGPVLAEVVCAGGTYPRWQLVQQETPTLAVTVVAYDQSGAATTVISSLGVTLGLNYYDFTVWQTGGTINVGLYGRRDDTVVPAFQFLQTGSLAGTLAGVTGVNLNPTRVTSTDEAMQWGHLAVWAAARLPDAVQGTWRDATNRVRYGAAYSFERETATERLSRLCAEEGVALTVPAVAVADSVIMGHQRAGTWAQLVDESVTADGGVLIEDRTAVGCVYRPRRTLYNPTPVVSLSYAAGHIAPPLLPVDDDDQVANDVTVERRDGASARSVETDGPLSVLPPPAGVGTYASSVTLNLRYDDAVADQAGWRRHLGTIDGSRYDQVAVQLDAVALRADAGRSAALAAVDAGDVVELVDLPAWVPPGPTRVMVAGYEEQVDVFTWSITYTAGPAAGWYVAVCGTTYRVGGAAVLAAAVTASATSLSITSTVANGPWTVDPAAFPLDVMVGGELVTLSAITGSGLTQTATVAAGGRARNGVARAWPSGTSVTPAAAGVAPL